jgi:ABC-2 type transport system permease protein
VLGLVMLAAIPQLFVTRQSGAAEARLKAWFGGEAFFGWPWTAVSNIIQGHSLLGASGVLLAWTAAAYLFARFQFQRTLNFDAQAAAANARKESRTSSARSPFEFIYRLPSVLFSDPLGALVEKEIRFLSRAPRFRLVFLMGFTFGLIIWLPMAFGREGGAATTIGRNYLTFVSVYSLLLLGEVCFWNTFGFDRSAAQVYFLAPVRFSVVLMAKNLAALFFILVEITAITLVCGLLRMPLQLSRLTEAYSVTLVVSLFLMSAGNLISVRSPRAVNPSHSFRRGTAGRMQALLLLIYPIASIPILMAYIARYAFNSQLAYYGVLAVDAAIGAIVYWVAMDSATADVESRKEQMVAALSRDEGPIAA